MSLRVAKDISQEDKFTKDFILHELINGNATIDRGSTSNFIVWLKNNRQIMAEIENII